MGCKHEWDEDRIHCTKCGELAPWCVEVPCTAPEDKIDLDKERGEIAVPEAVLYEFVALRESEDMEWNLDESEDILFGICDLAGTENLKKWIEKNPGKYMEGIKNGFRKE